VDDASHRTPARAELLVAAACLVAGFACFVAAAGQPRVSSEWLAISGNQVVFSADGREDAWQLANKLYAIGAWLTLTGVAALAVPLARRSARPFAPVLALSLLTGAVTLWTVTLAISLAVMRTAARREARDPAFYSPDVNDWLGVWFLNATALVAGAALVSFGLAVHAAGSPARWTGWFAAVCGALLFWQGATTDEVVPALLYIAPAPAGVAALARAVRRPRAAPTSGSPVSSAQ
jgi:hypothetical protein